MLVIMMVAGLSTAFAQSLSIADFTIGAGDSKTVTINLSQGEQAIYGVQTDITLSEGLSLDGVATVEGVASDAKIESQTLASGATRVMVYSEQRAAFSATATEVISLTVTAAKSFEAGTISLSNSFVTVSAAGAEQTVADATAQVSLGAVAGAYNFDFNKAIAVSNHDFIVGSNWGHIVGTGNYDGFGPYYMYYYYKATDGFDGTGALYATRQYAGDSWGGSECTDLLVTPLVNGLITLKVKVNGASSSYPSYVEIYQINEDGTQGELIQKFTPDEGYADIEGQDDWKQISLTLDEEQRIGIRAQYVIMDDFTAEAATIIPMKSLTVTGVMNEDKQTGTVGTNPVFEQQPDGKLKVVLKVALENTGDIALTAGMDGFSLTPAYNTYSAGAKTYCEEAIATLTNDLAVGAVDTVDVEFLVDLPETAYDGVFYNWFVRENVTGTTSSSSRYAKTALYQPKFVFRVAEGTATASLTTAQAYGTISEETTKQFEIANLGVAPLTIKSITLPEGFTSANAPTGELVLQKGAVQAIDITLPATTTGAFNDNLTIVYLDKDGAEQTYTLSFSGNVLAAGTWFADFDNAEERTPLYPEGSIAESGIKPDYNYSSGIYNYYLASYTSNSYATENNKFITPKLHANAGDQLSFDVAQNTYTSSNAYFVKVYKSVDRKNWGEPVAEYYYNDLASSYDKKVISFDEAGDFYVAFAIFGVKVDNIVGLQKVDVAHDLYIKKVNWPDASVKSGTSLSKPTVEFLPLTSEATDAYTVKFVCGETVLAEATSVELTASANSTKTITFNWTPNVEQTTTFEGAKVVFEFTDGTTFETEGFDLTVTNEPIFHFVSTLPSSKWNEPTDYTTPIDFGRTNTADKKTFYVYNWGSAPLTVKSIVVPDGFTATPAEQFTVNPFDENDMSVAAQAVEITFSATEAGYYGGEMVINYVNGAGEDASFTQALSGTMLDPSKFYANFEGEGWPAGSVYQSNVSSSNGGTYNAPNYYIYSSSETDNMFITPKLQAEAGDKIQFDAKLFSSSSYWSTGAVKVWAAATREAVLGKEGTRELLATINTDQDEVKKITDEYKTFEVALANAGDYYIGFEVSNRACLDEIYGLTVAPVAHELVIASSNIPTEGMQNYPLAASINIVNRGLAAEENYEIVLHMGDEVTTIAGEEAIPMHPKYAETGKQINLNLQSPVAGTFPVFVEVKAGDYTVATETVQVTFADEVPMADAIAVGEKSASNKNNAIIDFYNLDGGDKTGDVVYTAEQLNAFGITEGSKIVKFAFYGSSSSIKTIGALTAWYGMSTGEITPGSPDKENMTEVKIAESSLDIVYGSNEFAITLAEPLVYDGTSDLHFYFEGKKGGWASLSFDYDEAYKNLYWDGSTTAKANPLLYVTLVAEPATFAGTVKNAQEEAVEGAAITLVSADGDNVQYSGTTDAQGAYSISVIQANRTYAVSVVAEGYLEVTDTIAFGGENQTKDFTLASDFQPTDYTALVSTSDWLSEQGSVGGPVTIEGISQKEQYNGSTTALIDGDVLYQVVNNLPNGTYTVELYANASYTSGRGFTSDAVSGEIGRAVVYAGAVDKTIPVIDQTWVNKNNIVKLENVIVSDGTLRMGLRKIAPGSNWHTIQIKSLTQVAPEALPDLEAQDAYWQGVAATVAAYETYANVAGSERANLVAAATQEAAEAAIPPFYAAKAAYNALATVIEKGESIPMDMTEAKAVLNGAETTAAVAAAKAAELEHPVNLAYNTARATEGADMTFTIINPSFETGNTQGWTYQASNDHGAKRNDNATYTMTNCDGDFLFNIWSAGNAISQTIEDLPNGTYKLQAVIATDNGKKVQLNANDASVQIAAVGAGTGVEGELEFHVVNNKATIGAEGVGTWYKVDNFRLTYVKGFNLEELVAEYQTAYEAANAVDGKMNNDVQEALGNAIAANSNIDMTNPSVLGAATAALSEATAAANNSLAAYADAKAALEAMKRQMDATNVYTQDAFDAYNAVYTDKLAAYEAGTLTDAEAKAIENPEAILGWHNKNIIIDDFLLSAWDTEPNYPDVNPYYLNTWSIEATDGDVKFNVPFVEYWTSAAPLAERTMTATIEGLQPGDIYEVSALVRVQQMDGVTPAGVAMQVNDGEAVAITGNVVNANEHLYMDNYTAEGVVGEDGKLYIKFAVAADNNVKWLAFKNVKYVKSFIAGDANLDGQVTTGDAVAAVNFALEVETPSEKAFKAADVNKSNDITVSDAVAIVNIALNEEPATEFEGAGARIDLAGNYLTQDGAEVTLVNNQQFVGFQMDVTLAQGAVFNGVQLSQRAAGLHVAYNRVAENTYRIIAFSIDNNAIEANDGALFRLNITGEQNVSISKIEFADAAARAYSLKLAETTGIRSLNMAAEGTDVYTLGGVKSDKVRKGMNVVRQANGQVRKVMVK